MKLIKKTIKDKKKIIEEKEEMSKESRKQLEARGFTAAKFMKIIKRSRIESKNIELAEEFLRNMNESVIKLKELKRRLSKKISYKELKIAINDLEEDNKIVIGKKGITWVYNENKKIKDLIKKGTKI